MPEELSYQPSSPNQLVAELRAVKPTLQASRYATLEDLLKTQRWREADEETYRLMLSTVARRKVNTLMARL